jgi:hypothetical protein
MRSRAVILALAGVFAQAPPRANVPAIPFESSTDFLKISPDMNNWRVQRLTLHTDRSKAPTR